ESDQIVFTVTKTGTKTGNIVINGRVQGTDLNQASTVIDDTFDGGRGGIVVQTPAQVAVTASLPSQPKVTKGQGLTVRIAIVNTGGSDVAINLAGANPSFNPASGWNITGPTVLQGGGTILEAGAVDTLVVPVLAGNPGATRIDAVVPWTETNSSHTGSFSTSASGTGYGSILSQARSNLSVTLAVINAPNPAEVNVNQAFNVQVTVHNSGEADAASVVAGLATNGTSTILPVAPLALVPGGQNVAYQLPVQASAVTNPAEMFTGTIISGVDANSGLGTLVDYTQSSNNKATVAIQTPATLNIMAAHPSQPTVTRSQAIPWKVVVAVQNAGQADVDLTPPAASDLGFSIAGATKIDYIVQAPTKFASGLAGWRLAGGATDSLAYDVITTGADTGTVDITLGVGGKDRNDPTQILSDSGATSVRVQDVAGLFIASTVPVGTFNHASVARDTVNTNFAYEIHVTVQNSGGELVDSVGVQLAKDGGSTVKPASLKRVSIAAGASHEFVYGITAPSSPTALETFTSSIMPGVKSHNSGVTVTPQAPLDNTHLVVVETRANLSLGLAITAPPGATGGVVSPNQVFTMSAQVSNLGQAGLSGPAEVTLTVPSGFSVQEQVQRAFAANTPVTWTVTAPPAPQAALDFACTINTVPNDVNTAATAFVSKLNATSSVSVGTGGALAGPAVSLTAPAGAQDDTLSVSQSFTLHAVVTPTSETQSVVATLSVPIGFNIIGGSAVSLGDGNGQPKTHDFSLIAPSNATASAPLFVTFTGIDKNSGDPVPSSADTVLATVVPRTSLTLSASITAPPDAIDNSVAIATPFTVTAVVANDPGAADIAAPGNLKITLPPGYSLGAGETAIKPFVVATPVAWIVNANSQPSGPDQIAITISSVPLDENSGVAARVATGTANIAIVTEGAAVSVSDVSKSLNVGTAVAPGGATNLDIMAFQIAYNVTDPNVNPAEVDTIAFTVLDKNDKALGASAVASTIKRLAVDLGGSQAYEVVNPGTNPVVVSFVGGGSDRNINPDGSITARVYLDLGSNPRATEIKLRVHGGGMVVRDPGSGQALGVTDEQGRPLDGQITSGSLVILSSNFEEYAHNYPNPFRAGSAETRIAYFMDAPASVSIRIFDVTGALVYEESIPASDPRAQKGPQEATWDGRNMKGDVVRNGIYICVLSAGPHSAKIRIAVAK
ncbi:MAG TPA: hypothetical protein VFH88_13700, partial [Candidatus Krumholzibacteria bacterium]|nr:hypothetical protein [Candidatus Krumholzibacteria bacterium]